MRRIPLVLGASAVLFGLAWLPSSSDPVPRPEEPTKVTTDLPRAAAPETLSAEAVSRAAFDAVAAASDAVHGEAYFADRVLVAVDPGLVASVARRHGLQVLRVSEQVGLARLSVPEGRSVADVIDALGADPDVERSFAAGRMTGACKHHDSDAEVDPGSFQWHLAHGNLKGRKGDVRGLVVAVLDSGVAYEDHADETGTYVAAPSLSNTPIVAPADFVNDDAHANDDHRHGTHIASIILSEGTVTGIAPGAGLMPLKVLDEHNQGDELSLVEALYHAVDNGADVINMSLSFGSGFAPSVDLQQALAYAAKRGSVMVAASGNASANQVSWPAASPLVIAVGATAPDKDNKPVIPEYANVGAVDILAPGGDVGVDRNKDGFVDGLLAETFFPGDPTAVGYWFQAGTSQAAAVVSGTVLHLLGSGASADEARAALQDGASTKELPDDAFEAGTGAGLLDIEASIKSVQDHKVPQLERHYVSVMPYIKVSKDELEPRARITVVDADGEPIDKAKVHALAMGSTTGREACTTNEDGQCTMKGPKLEADPTDAAAWSWEVETVEQHRISAPIGTVMFADLPLEILLSSIEDDAFLRNSLFAVHWPEGKDDELGELAESYTLSNHGTGLVSSPLGLAFTPGALGDHQLDLHELSLEGTGLVSSPLGLLTMQRITIEPEDSALLQLASRGREMRFVAADGSGLVSSPLGFSALAMFEPVDSVPSYSSTAGSGLVSSPLGFSSQPIFLSDDAVGLSWLVGTAVGDILSAGGWTTEDGLPAGMAALGTGLVPAEEPIDADTSIGAELLP